MRKHGVDYLSALADVEGFISIWMILWQFGHVSMMLLVFVWFVLMYL